MRPLIPYWFGVNQRYRLALEQCFRSILHNICALNVSINDILQTLLYHSKELKYTAIQAKVLFSTIVFVSIPRGCAWIKPRESTVRVPVDCSVGCVALEPRCPVCTRSAKPLSLGESNGFNSKVLRRGIAVREVSAVCETPSIRHIPR